MGNNKNRNPNYSKGSKFVPKQFNLWVKKTLNTDIL